MSSDNPDPVACVDVLEIDGTRMTLAGWMFHPSDTLATLRVKDGRGSAHPLPWLPSPDVAAVHGARAAHCRFQATVTFAHWPDPKTTALEATIAGVARIVQVPILSVYSVAADPYHRLFRDFLTRVNAMEAPNVVEIGARARSGNSHFQMFGSHVRYTGMDIVAGENVQIVGDAHRLGDLLPAASVDAIFSISVFEHLAMPWKVALECNRVLQPGGIVFVATHQTWPVHDAPWDFWRFSSSAWQVLFNPATGFRVIEAVMGLPASINPGYKSGPMQGLEKEPAFLGTGVIAEKIGNTSLSWPVDLQTVVDGLYPR